MATGEIDREEVLPRPGRRVRWLFWLILGAFSVFFAEVTVGATLYAFFHPFSLLVTWPLYALHILVLAGLVIRGPTVRFATLYFAGAVFGLYEAYITKVLWAPPWSENPLRVGGVAVIETLLLVLFYHCVLAFLIPLVVAERLLTRSRVVLGSFRPRPARWLDSRAGLAVLAAACGITQTANSPSFGETVLSTVLSAGFLLVLVVAWQHVTRGRAYTLDQLLPRGRELVVLGLLLASQYLGLGLLLNRDKVPGLVGQGAILALYGLFIGLLIASIRRPAAAVEAPAGPVSPWPWQRWLLFTLVFSATAAVFQPLAVYLRIPIFVALWAGGIVLGLVLFVVSTWRTLGGVRARGPDSATAS